jgi:pimeloyl-ACP methyl ester carboxylesterase
MLHANQTPGRPGLLLVGALSLVVCTTPIVRADLIFLKDGTVLQGKLGHENTLEFDPVTKEPMRMPIGFYVCDDGARRIYFPQSQVSRLVTQQEGASDVRIDFPKPYSVPAMRVIPIHQILETDPWDEKWNRRIRFRSGDITASVNQHLALLTPQYAKVDATNRFAWADYYGINELGPQVVQNLLATNPKFADDPKLKEEERIIRRLRICEFYLQTGWFDLADRDLAKLAKDFPASKAQVDAARDVLKRSRAREMFELIKRIHGAGQYKAVTAALTAFPDKDASEDTAAEFRAFKATFDDAAAKYTETRRMLDAVAGDLKDAPEGLAQALASVRAELHPDRANRLEAFLGQAQQAERQRKAGRSPEVSPGSLAALAVTGWLLGGPSSEPKPETALKLWRSRELVLNYLRAEDAGAREKLLLDFKKHKVDFAGLDEFCQLIPQLPPEAPEASITGAAIELKAGDSKAGALYLVKLPREYSHNRQYPVLISLPPSGEPAANSLARLEASSAENGYILVVPRWEKEQGAGYKFSDREHQVVLDVLRDVRRRFQVDSDRVFLFGAGFGGGDMAFDIGLSHPDLFAGVIPMAAGPLYFSEAYWRSAQYLPFYVITGDRSGDGNKKVREQFNNWIPRGFNSVWVQYKGRGVEWFGGELPAIFEWMREKKRAFPLRQLGQSGMGSPLGTEFLSMRDCDNRFYWLTIDDILSKRHNSVENWNSRVEPVRLSARIDPAANQISVNAEGVRQLTIWLGRNGKGENMIDFDKPVKVLGRQLNLLRTSRPVVPSLEVLLNDLIDRGDRQRLFLAKIDLKF